MASRETENNAYAKFWGDKQRALWYVMVFLEWSITVACAGAGPLTRLNICIVCLQISEQKLVLISSRVARTYHM